MSDERFDRIDKRFTEIDGRFDQVDEKFRQVDTRFDEVDQRLDRLEAGQNELRSGQDELRSGQNELRSGQNELRPGLSDLDRHMHVLHEEVMARFAAIPEFSGPTKAEFAEGLADLKEAIGRRLDPLEAAVRQHTVEIKGLKEARG